MNRETFGLKQLNRETFGLKQSATVRINIDFLFALDLKLINQSHDARKVGLHGKTEQEHARMLLFYPVTCTVDLIMIVQQDHAVEMVLVFSETYCKHLNTHSCSSASYYIAIDKNLGVAMGF